jgi:hypothetical protein
VKTFHASNRARVPLNAVPLFHSRQQILESEKKEPSDAGQSALARPGNVQSAYVWQMERPETQTLFGEGT